MDEPHPIDVAEYSADVLYQLSRLVGTAGLAELSWEIRNAAITAAFEQLRLEAEAEGRPFSFSCGFT